MLKLASQAADVGSSHVDLPIAYEGKTVEITFDPRYLIDALKTLDDTTAITAELIDAKNAAVFRTADHYTYVVMPLTPRTLGALQETGSFVKRRKARGLL